MSTSMGTFGPNCINGELASPKCVSLDSSIVTGGCNTDGISKSSRASKCPIPVRMRKYFSSEEKQSEPTDKKPRENPIKECINLVQRNVKCGTKPKLRVKMLTTIFPLNHICE